MHCTGAKIDSFIFWCFFFHLAGVAKCSIFFRAKLCCYVLSEAFVAFNRVFVLPYCPHAAPYWHVEEIIKAFLIILLDLFERMFDGSLSHKLL